MGNPIDKQRLIDIVRGVAVIVPVLCDWLGADEALVSVMRVVGATVLVAMSIVAFKLSDSVPLRRVNLLWVVAGSALLCATALSDFA